MLNMFWNESLSEGPIILALDPGVTTGAAVMNPDTGGLSCFQWTIHEVFDFLPRFCLLYTSPSPRDQRGSRMPSSA